MTVFFTNKTEKRLIGNCETVQDGYKIITNFLKERNYESPYWRMSRYEDHEWIDVGSYTEFFEIYFEE